MQAYSLDLLICSSSLSIGVLIRVFIVLPSVPLIICSQVVVSDSRDMFALIASTVHPMSSSRTVRFSTEFPKAKIPIMG